MISFAQFEQNLASLRERIALACSNCGRAAGDVQILPVTKNHPKEAAIYALDAGLCAVGENRVQEAEGKIPFVDSSLDWELIGHLQTNKAKKAAEMFARIQSVDSVKLLQKLDSAACENGKNLRVLLQINSGRDPAKFGAEIEDARALMEAALACKNLKLEGLMAIAPLDDNLDVAKKTFETLRVLRDDMQGEFKHPLPELSMGMSGDLECAVEAGSTMIRVGTFLYGAREY